MRGPFFFLSSSPLAQEEEGGNRHHQDAHRRREDKGGTHRGDVCGAVQPLVRLKGELPLAESPVDVVVRVVEEADELVAGAGHGVPLEEGLEVTRALGAREVLPYEVKEAPRPFGGRERGRRVVRDRVQEDPPRGTPAVDVRADALGDAHQLQAFPL